MNRQWNFAEFNMVITGYSINILPPGKEYNRFVNLINKLAKEYDAPIFAPHITVLGQASENEKEALRGLEELVINQHASFKFVVR